MGATTMWERWDSLLPDGRVNPGDMTSFNHYALGAVGEWMWNVMAGLKTLEPGWRKFRISPVPGGSIKSVDARYLSPYGMIRVSWKIEAATFVMDVEVPPNAMAEVRLPGSSEVVTVGSGSRRFEAEYTAPEWPIQPIYRPFTAHDDDWVDVADGMDSKL
jgi:alpha-L-rhamnosidase